MRRNDLLRVVPILLCTNVLTSCHPREDRDCYPNMALGAEYEIRVLEAWSRESQFTWPPNTDRLVEPYPHCDGADGLRAGGSFRIRLTQRQYMPQFGTCFDYVGTPIDGIIGVDFDEAPRMIRGPFSAFVFTPDGYYKMFTYTDRESPVGLRARPGLSPPIVLVREAACGIDLFAAEMHRIPEPSDASIDARAMDAGQADQ